MQISKMAEGQLYTKSATYIVAKMRALQMTSSKNCIIRQRRSLSLVSSLANWQCDCAMLEKHIKQNNLHPQGLHALAWAA